MTGGGPLPSVATDWWLIERTGWTLEYVRSLPVGALKDYLQVLDGRAKADKSYLK